MLDFPNFEGFVYCFLPKERRFYCTWAHKNINLSSDFVGKGNEYSIIDVGADRRL